MALPGHSPPPYIVAGSPQRALNGYPDQNFAPSVYRHSQPMPPPSPQQFTNRYHPVPPPSMPHPAPHFDMKAPQQMPQHHIPPPPPPPSSMHKRPGSSMSISSMLGEQPERPHESQFHTSQPPRPGTVAAPMSVGAMMSPPQQPSRPGVDHLYNRDRAQTPDRFGSRTRGISIGTATAVTHPMYDHQDRFAQPPAVSFPAPSPFTGLQTSQHEQDERVRRTSLSGILQRPSSQPQQPLLISETRSLESQPPGRRAWYADPPRPQPEPPRVNGFTSNYDTRPPGFRDSQRNLHTTHSTSVPQPQTQSISPELRRTTNIAFNRGLAGLLNGPPSQSPDTQASAHGMIRQTSTQSQGSHTHKSDFRHYSPFNANFNNPHGIAASIEDQTRKGSDEIAHKTIVGLGLESRRGRFSPVPQAVQGAQAQTPVPESVKSEQGRIFSGIGGGMGPASTGATPVSQVGSPFKKDASIAKVTSEPIKVRSTNGKRSRKPQDEVDGEPAEARRGGANTKTNKRTKYQNNYKADLEDLAMPTVPRRGTTLSNAGAARTTSNPITSSTLTRYDSTLPKHRKVVKTALIMSQALKHPRRHLGTFTYKPDILIPEQLNDSSDSQIIIKPNLLPIFDSPNDINCTVRIRIPRMWLADRERRLICQTRNLWGTGIYTDDSDPVAAAIHMGWLRPSFGPGVDEALLAKIVKEQNPKVEVAKEFKPPTMPLDTSGDRDLHVTLVIMPRLDSYASTARFGLRSRSWPGAETHTAHDGVSFAISACELVDSGREEVRVGRTGVEKRARLRAQLEARAHAAVQEKERIAKLLKRQMQRKRSDVQRDKERSGKGNPVKATSEDMTTTRLVSVGAAEQVTVSAGSVPAGQDWIGQLATAAA